MGYWGTLVTARGTRTPAALAALGAEVRTHDGAVRGDGWRVYDVPGNALGQGPAPLIALARDTSSPVIAAYIADSDYGQVIAAGPAGGPWGVWLARSTAYAFERDHHRMAGLGRAGARRRARQVIAGFGSPPGPAARRAVAWAAEAGYAVPAGPIRQILRTGRRPGPGAWLRLPAARYVFAEDAYFDLLDRLGLPRAPG